MSSITIRARAITIICNKQFHCWLFELIAQITKFVIVKHIWCGNLYNYSIALGKNEIGLKKIVILCVSCKIIVINKIVLRWRPLTTVDDSVWCDKIITWAKIFFYKSLLGITYYYYWRIEKSSIQNEQQRLN